MGAPNRITFNTKRLYTPLGQVVTAELHADRVLFKDHSRGICGEIWSNPGTTIPQSVATWAMHWYDRGHYRLSVEAINLEQSDTIHVF